MLNDAIANSYRTFSVHPGELLQGRYRIGEAIGTGAYGEIFGAVDEQTGQQVAIKALPLAGRDIHDTARGRFQREMMVIRNLNHPNIIAIYDWGERDNQVVFMALEYVEGHTLERIVRNQPMALEQAIHVAHQIALALQAAHVLGVIHRDLKPANIMLSQTSEGDYVVKVLDFGMAKMLSKIEDESIVELTREGMAVGTPRYIAPEQARGLPVGPTTDLYALGLLLYEMLTGVQAVKADSVELAVRAHVSAEPLELAEIDQVPAMVRPVLAKLLEKKVVNRYQDAAEVLVQLEALGQELERLKCDADNSFWSMGGRRTGGFFMPRQPMEIIEALGAVLLLLLAWWLIRVQFSENGLIIAWVLGLSIPCTAAMVAYVLDSDTWSYGVWRVLGILSLTATVVGFVAVL